MNIDSKSEIAGFPALLVRNLMRRIGAFEIYSIFVARQLHISNEEAEKMIKLLVKQGFLVETDYSHNERRYEATLKGRSLALASAAKPITRKTADRILEEFLDRVKNINSDSYFLYKVSKVDIFGSYLTDKEKISDIDISVEIQPKYNTEEQWEKDEARRQEAYDKEIKFPNFVEQLYWPMTEVLKKLKNHSRAISLHNGDKIVDKVEHKTIFES